MPSALSANGMYLHRSPALSLVTTITLSEAVAADSGLLSVTARSARSKTDAGAVCMQSGGGQALAGLMDF